jgi:hypothetical protein
MSGRRCAERVTLAILRIPGVIRIVRPAARSGSRSQGGGSVRGSGKPTCRRTYQQQLEVGVHNSDIRVDVTISSLDSDPLVTDPSPTATHSIAEPII